MKEPGKMDKKEAKLLLSGYRPNGKDAGDPEMRQALDLLDGDAELKEWFDQEQEFDALISEKLNEFKAPEDGKTSGMAGNRIVRPPKWWNRPTLLAAAALVLALASIAITQWPSSAPPQATLADLRSGAVDKVRGDFKAEFYSADPVQIDRWLMDQDLPVAGRNIAERVQGKKFGCAKMLWNGQAVSVICLQKDEQNIAHLFIAKLPETDPNSTPPSEEIILATVRDLNTAAWKDGDKAYVLVGHAPSVRVARFL